MAEKTDYVKVAVEPERKQRWDEAVSDNPNVGTLSGLVRLAVEQAVGEKPDSGADVGEEVTESLGEILEVCSQLESRQQALEARLGSIEQAVQDDPEVAELANEVFMALPEREDLEQYDDPEAGPVPDWLPEDEGGPLVYSGRVADIATLTGESELQVQRAIDKIQSDTGRIQETDDGRYWKEV